MNITDTNIADFIKAHWRKDRQTENARPSVPGQYPSAVSGFIEANIEGQTKTFHVVIRELKTKP